MSFNLTAFNPINYQGARAIAKPVAICTKPEMAPAIARVEIDWSEYNAGSANRRIAVAVNLYAQQTTPLDQIRSIKIDNTFCDVAMYVQFSDTLDTIVCPPNNIVIAPVYTKNQEFIVFGDGFFDGRFPKTAIELANFDRQGLVVPAPIANKITGRYEGMSERPGISSGFTFSDIPLVAAPDNNRLLAFTLIARPNAGGAFDYTALTINGIVPTIALNTVDSITSDGSRNWRAILAYALVPTGTVASIAVTWSAQQVQSSVAVWSLLDWTQLAPFSSDFDVGITVDSLRIMGVNVIPGAFMVGGQFQFTATPGQVELTGAELDDISIDAVRLYEAAYFSEEYNVNDRRPVSIIGNGILGAVWI